MYSKTLFIYLLFIVFIALNIHQISSKGCVNLDEISFSKILPKFEVILVKFDVEFPSGDTHEIYTKFASEVANNNDIILGQVEVKDYGEKDNEDFAKLYGITKEDFPMIKLFKKGFDIPVTFPKEQEFNLNNFRKFVRDNSKIYIGLPGCIETFDQIAQKFVISKNKSEQLQKATILQDSLNDKNKESAKTYIIMMKKIIENGVKFISQERERVYKLLKGKISTKKQNELNAKLNILEAFSMTQKDEL